MRHAISSASRGSREVRGAKLTEKRTRGAPCSFKCKQGLQGRKLQGRQIDGEKDERGAMQFQVQAGAPGKRKLHWRQIDGEKENKSLNCQTYFPFGFKIRNVVFLNCHNYDVSFFYVSPVFHNASAVASLKL